MEACSFEKLQFILGQAFLAQFSEFCFFCGRNTILHRGNGTWKWSFSSNRRTLKTSLWRAFHVLKFILKKALPFFAAQLQGRRKSRRPWRSGVGWLGQLPLQPGNRYRSACAVWGTPLRERALEFYHWPCRVLHFSSALLSDLHISWDFWPVLFRWHFFELGRTCATSRGG